MPYNTVVKIITLTPDNLSSALAEASATLLAGGLVLYPTETVYGAGVDATNQTAVNKLLSYKSRREGKPLSIAVTNAEMASKFVTVNEQARKLYQQFLPGPVTVISAVRPEAPLALGVASEFGTLGIRISSHPLVTELTQTFGRPITATSANASGKRRPYSVQQILDNLSEKQKNLIDLILDAGTLPNQPPSTVIDTTLSTPVVFRQGSVQANTEKTTTLRSKNEPETKAIAGKLLLKQWNNVKNQPIIFALNGPLGAGKTVFAKGIAEFLGIKSNLVSPTYTYIEEYPFLRGQTKGRLFHLDMWKVDSADIFDKLEVGSLLQPQLILVIEWYSQVAPWLEPQLTRKKAQILTVELRDLGNSRELVISEI